MIRDHRCVELDETNPFYYSYVSFRRRMNTWPVDEVWFGLEKKSNVPDLVYREFNSHLFSPTTWSVRLLYFRFPHISPASPISFLRAFPLPLPALAVLLPPADLLLQCCCQGKLEHRENRRQKEKGRKGQGCTNPRPLGDQGEMVLI